MEVTIGVSNHHVHVTAEDLKILFGENAELEYFKALNQPGQFASNNRVDIKTEAGVLKGLRILGPCRNYTQVELSETDCRNLKITAPVRSSGDLENATSVEIVGSKGSIIRSAAIIANRHIHITPQQRKELGLDRDEVSVQVATEKGGTFEHVFLKESEESYFEMHIDTDDANAFLIKTGQKAKIVV